MENQPNKLVAVAYKLFSVENDVEKLVEEATDERPFIFISGFGITLEDFENAVVNLKEGEEFELNLSPDRAYGNYEEERVLNLDKEMFKVNGHFDHDNIFKDAVVPLQNEDGNHFMGHVLEITDDSVHMDLNHPLAGKTLKFKGHIVENREATNEEIQHFVNMINGEHECDHCEGCGDCGDESNEHEHHCGNHNGSCCHHNNEHKD
jgi:FKBP-type peptidyl-prolyl cis-trans isomerase SlyD